MIDNAHNRTAIPGRHAVTVTPQPPRRPPLLPPLRPDPGIEPRIFFLIGSGTPPAPLTEARSDTPSPG
jgi:hypothetical protein